MAICEPSTPRHRTTDERIRAIVELPLDRWPLAHTPLDPDGRPIPLDETGRPIPPVGDPPNVVLPHERTWTEEDEEGKPSWPRVVPLRDDQIEYDMTAFICYVSLYRHEMERLDGPDPLGAELLDELKYAAEECPCRSLELPYERSNMDLWGDAVEFASLSEYIYADEWHWWYLPLLMEKDGELNRHFDNLTAEMVKRVLAAIRAEPWYVQPMSARRQVEADELVERTWVERHEWRGLARSLNGTTVLRQLAADATWDRSTETDHPHAFPWIWPEHPSETAMGAAHEQATTTAPGAPGADRQAVVGMTMVVAPAEAEGGLPEGELVQAPILLPSEFFDGCPELEIVRQAAHNRMVSPTALAITLLTRIASMADHRLRLPALVGSYVGLSFFTVLTAKVGGGKSSTVNLAVELLGTDPTSTREIQLISGNGTGEGLVEGHIGLVEEEGSRSKVRQQVVHNSFWYVDEGMNLIAEFGRKNSTTTGILCSGWFCAGVGQNNASEGLNRNLAALSYNWGILIAIQDANAHHLLEQEGIGLTQRCFWVEGWDPTIPDPDHLPEWPGSLDWRHPEMPGDIPVALQGRVSAPATGGGAPRYIKLPTWYEKEQKWALYRQKQTGKVDPLSEHIILMEIKLAVHIGMLRGHVDPTDDDIRRARIAIGAHKKQIRRASNRTRLAEVEDQRAQAQITEQKAEQRTLAVEAAVRSKIEAEVVKRHAEGIHATWRQIRIRIGGRHMKELGDEKVADIVTELVIAGRIVEVSRDSAGNPTYDTP